MLGPVPWHRCVELWPSGLESKVALVGIQTAPLLIQHPANSLGKSTEGGPSVWASVPMRNTRKKLLAAGIKWAQVPLMWPFEESTIKCKSSIPLFSVSLPFK